MNTTAYTTFIGLLLMGSFCRAEDIMDYLASKPATQLDLQIIKLENVVNDMVCNKGEVCSSLVFYSPDTKTINLYLTSTQKKMDNHAAIADNIIRELLTVKTYYEMGVDIPTGGPTESKIGVDFLKHINVVIRVVGIDKVLIVNKLLNDDIYSSEYIRRSDWMKRKD